jgi:uncharacterized spore protein YtfJ
MNKQEKKPKMSTKLESIKANLSPDDGDQLSEYIDALQEIMKSIKLLIKKSSKSKKSNKQEVDEVGGNMMHQYKSIN